VTGMAQTRRHCPYLVFAALLLTAFLPVQVLSSPEYRAVTILHTNDTHGHLLPFSYPEPPSVYADYASMPHTKDIGGIARRATLVRRVENEVKGEVLLLDAGDVLDGTPFSIEYKGEADFAAMSAVGYDAFTPGNHEFNLSLQEFWRNARVATFPILCANLVDKKAQDVLPDYKIFDVQGVKIAVFGLTIPNDYRAVKEGFDFLDPYKVAKELVPKLKKQADIVVALTHLGIENDMRLAQEVPEIDIIVGGHSHTRLTAPILVKHDGKESAFSVNGTIIVQAHQWGGELGRLDLRLRKNSTPFTIMSFSGKLIPVTPDIPEDQATAKIVAKYYKPILAKYERIVGKASETFYNDNDCENSLLNLVCDALREASGAQAALYNVGGVRSDLQKGTIKFWDLATVFPFQNKLILLKTSGKQLKKALETQQLGVSGIRYRIASGKLVTATIDGKPIEDEKLYTIATTDFIEERTFEEVFERKVIADDYREAIVAYIQARKTVTPVLDGRRVIE
jgi:5'-nucleotidase/UDP-sugar diphosphatase